MLAIYSYLTEDGQSQNEIKKGSKVKIVTKENQGTENYDEGKVEKILTKKKKHPRGIKVRLENGKIGRVQEILEY